jgi:hypothetical protein
VLRKCELVVLVWFGAGGGRVVVWMFGVGLWW